MKSKAAVLFTQPGDWEVVEVDLDEPRHGEVLVRMVASGLCHSDDHYPKDHLPVPLPWCGGHEGAGVVAAVGPNVEGLEPGDHVVLSFIPACGRCRWCASGMQNLCDNGRLITVGKQLDGTHRMHHNGVGVAQTALISTFSEYTVVPQLSCIKIPKDVPLEEACLLACGVPTGWGAAVAGAGVQPGDVTIVMGIGGLGINAVQGAAAAGAARVIAVDPVEFKRKMALTLGATDAVADMRSATRLARSLTNGQGADNAVVTVGVTTSQHIAEAFSSIRKAGTLAVAGVGPADGAIPIDFRELISYQKRMHGVLYGTLSPNKDVPRLLDYYLSGRLKLKELITRTYTLDQINEGYADMHAGLNVRGVIVFD